MHISDDNSSAKINSPRKSGDKSSPEKGGSILDTVVNKLKEKHDVLEHMEKLLNEDLSVIKEENPKILYHNKATDLLIEKIGNNKVAVFQTLVNSVSRKDVTKDDNMKSQVSSQFFPFSTLCYEYLYSLYLKFSSSINKMLSYIHVSKNIN